MKAGRFINGWTLVTLLLIAIIIAGGVIIWSGYSRGQPIEISLPPATEVQGDIYIGGEVNNPGYYLLQSGDSIDDLLRAAGGVTEGADPNRVELIVPASYEGEVTQKVNINRAEAWLLAALPGIGEVRARAIVAYRQQNGLFRDTKELTKVEGVGYATYENIEHLITVAD